MTVVIEMLAEMVLDKIGIVVANDSARSSFTVAAGDSLLALDPGLKVLGQWPSDARSRGWHSTSPGRGLALDAGWDDWVLSDVDPSGTKVITTPHNTGPLLVRAFPSLEVLRAIDPPGQEAGWDFTACFAGDLLIGKLTGPHERLMAIGHDDTVHDLDEQEDGWLIPAAHGTWLAATRTTIRRCRIPRSDKGGSATG